MFQVKQGDPKKYNLTFFEKWHKEDKNNSTIIIFYMIQNNLNQFVHVFLKVHVLGGLVSWFFWVHTF
jgi:hypothetical protein